MTTPFQLRMHIAWSMVMFFCGISGRSWDDLSVMEQLEVHAFAASIRE